MREMASEIVGVPIAYSTVCSGADQRKHQSSAALAVLRGVDWRPVNSLHKDPVAQTIFIFDDIIMLGWLPIIHDIQQRYYYNKWAQSSRSKVMAKSNHIAGGNVSGKSYTVLTMSMLYVSAYLRVFRWATYQILVNDAQLVYSWQGSGPFVEHFSKPPRDIVILSEVRCLFK